MVRKPNTGRRAGEDYRARAVEWVELYRLAQASPDGRHCLNPEDDYEEQTFIYGDDPGPLLQALGGFARHGTFEFIDSYGIAEMLMRHELKTLRAGGLTYQNAILALAEKHHKSESTIGRMVRLLSKRDTD